MSWSYFLSGTCYITAPSTWNFSPKLVRPVVCKPCYAPSSLIILILFKFLTISFVRFYLSNLWLSQSERVPIFGAFVRHLSRRVFPMVGHLSWKVFPGEGNFSLLNLHVIFCTILKKGKSLSNYNCMKLVAPSLLSICSFPKWYWGRIDGHAWNGLSKPWKFCRKFTSVSIGILQINYCPREIPRRHSTSNSRVYLPPQGFRPEGEIPRRHSSNSRVC